MATFRTTSKTVNVPESPSTLFHDLSDRSDTVKYLWAHQKELLDTYHAKHLDTWNAPVLRSSRYERTIMLSVAPLPGGVGCSAAEPGADGQRAAYSAGVW